MTGDSPSSGRNEHWETYLRESLRPTRILLVEDDANTCEIIQDCTGDFNVEWDVAQLPEEARQLFGFFAYDLILLDLRLAAGRSGAELLHDVEHDDTRNIIIFTRYPDSPEAADAIKHGALVFVIKPNCITREWASRFLRTFGVPRKVKPPAPA